MAGAETILVVEDDAQVRGYVEFTLTQLGYKILSARDGDAALKHLDQGQVIDLLFSDLMLPGALNGYGLAEAAAASGLG